MKNLTRFIALCSLLFLAAHGPAQNHYVNFERLGQEQQLTLSSTLCLFQDSRGFIWIGGYAGLFRYDGQEVRSFSFNPSDTFRISDHRVEQIAEDAKGNLWIGTQSGLNYYDHQSEKFYSNFSDSSINVFAMLMDAHQTLWLIDDMLNLYLYRIEEDTLIPVEIKGRRTEAAKKYTALCQDQAEGVIWIGAHNGLTAYDPQTGSFREIDARGALRKQGIWSITPEKGKGLWLGLTNGIAFYDYATGKIAEYPFDLAVTDSVRYRNILIQPDRTLWIGSSRGLVRFNPESGKMDRYLYDFNRPSSISNDNILCLIRDKSNVAWAGTTKGVFRFDLRSERFTKIKNDFSGQISSILNLRTYHEISPGNILISGKDGLEILNWKTNARTPFPYRPNAGLADWKAGVICYYTDNKGRLWMGTSRGGAFVFDWNTKAYRQYAPDPGDPYSISGPTIRDIIQDKRGDLWFATWSQGICRFSESTGTFKRYLETAGMESDARNFYLDRQQNLWVGTRGGLFRYHYDTDRFTRYHHDPADPGSMSENTAFDTYQDADGIFWIGTYGGGLNRFDPNSGKFTHYTTSDGLLDNTVFCVLPDNSGNLWLSTFRGLCKFDPKTETFTSFTQRDGLLNESYDAFGYFKSPSSGHLFFEGPLGLDIFHPDSIRPDPVTPEVVFTEFYVFNQPVPIARDGKKAKGGFVLPASITALKKIVLPYRFKVIGIKYAATHYANPDKNRYAYKLEGFDRDWQHVGNQRLTTFTNLAPGRYTFRVKAANPDGVWNESATALAIVVRPPWWRTWWAYMLYVLTFIGLLLGLIAYLRERWRLKAKLAMEHREAKRLKELDDIKTTLYTNITHEFRTPLTVILGAAGQIRSEPEKWLTQGTDMIIRNGRQLLELVNQMLDLRKLESGSMKTNWVYGDVVEYLKYLCESFHSLAESKNIAIRFTSNPEAIPMDYDPEKLLRMAGNLVSNALKFTPEGGSIFVEAARLEQNSPKLSLTVRDTGIGIAPENLPHIFDRFYQADNSATRAAGGTGIGLALVAELVKLLNGEITVKSESGQGTAFHLLLPIHETAKDAVREASAGILVPEPYPVSLAAVPDEEFTPEAAEKPVLLIIEDNPDVVRYLQACLQEHYAILVAYNGEEGIQKALSQVPDAIISDVMMPLKDGFEVCAVLKEEEQTSHIPIILLTARADVESRIKGLKRGADDYLAKPFDQAELKARLNNLIALRQKLQKRYAALPQLPPPSADEGVQKEDAFVQKVLEVLEAYYTDADFRVPEFCRAMAMSRTQLHNKFRALFGMSTTDFVNRFRVRKARQLLETSSLNVSEVAYEVGYNDPKYFSERYFFEFKERPIDTLNKR